MTDDDRLFLAKGPHQGDHVADNVEDACRLDIRRRAVCPKPRISGATTWKPTSASAGIWCRQE